MVHVCQHDRSRRRARDLGADLRCGRLRAVVGVHAEAEGPFAEFVNDRDRDVVVVGGGGAKPGRRLTCQRGSLVWLVQTSVTTWSADWVPLIP